MLTKLYNKYQKFRESLFFVPALISVFYSLICLGLFWFEVVVLSEKMDVSHFYQGDVAEAQSLIQVLLSAMITMTSLVVSVTMVVINLSASQLGPRIIRSVLSDHKTKVYVGCFFGSITACFVALGILNQLPDSGNVPGLSVGFVFLSCFFNLFILLAYVHHLAHLSVADSLISKVHNELMTSISRLKSIEAEQNEKTSSRKDTIPEDFSDKAKPIHSGKSGYIQTIDYRSLKAAAEEKSLCLEILIDAGDYVLEGQKIIRGYPANQITPEVEKECEQAIVFGEDRTGAQDIEYSVRHLVEVGLRALSPGINDNYTASIVLSKLSSALAALFQKELPDNAFKTKEGSTCVFGQANCYKTIIDEAFSRIRIAGAQKPDILQKLIETIAALYPLTRTKDQKQALKEELDHVAEHVENLESAQETQILKKTLDDLRSTL